MKTSETIGKLAAALLKAQSSMGNAVKGAANPYFKSSFADLNSIREVVTPALNANGISVLQPTTVQDGKYFVQTVLLHESGEFISGLTEIVAAKVNDPQATGSAISYARRYGLQSFLSVGAVDEDGEAAMGRGKSSGPSPAQIKYEAKKVTAEPAVVATSTSAAPVAQAVATEPVVAKKKSMFTKPGSSNNGQASTSSEDSWT